MSQRVVHYTISDFKNCVNKLSSKRERNLSETSKHKSHRSRHFYFMLWIRTYNHTAWASNSGEEKDSLDHSATGHLITLKEQQTTVHLQATI